MQTPARGHDLRRPPVVSYASQLVQLGAGDMVLTGSPAGNRRALRRFLRDGDVMDAEITGLGRQRNRCGGRRARNPPPTALG